MQKAFLITGMVLAGILAVLAAAAVLLLAARLIGRAVKRRTPRGGISETAYVDINGTKQWISIYGQDRDNPVLLFLHGGPGSSTSHMDHAYTRKWSDVYTVVTWDQRGCGKSYAASRTEAITADVMMRDGREMTEYLLARLNREKITLLGHSWGSLYGANLALEHPEYYEAFIGAGQLIDCRENERRLCAAAQEWSEGDAGGKALLAKWSPDRPYSAEAVRARSGILERYGFGMMKDGRDYSLFAAVLFNPYYTIREYLGYVRNRGKAVLPYLDFFTGDTAKLSLSGRYDYQVPYYNINGDMDHQTDFRLACEYFRQVNAPEKEMFVMKNATHGLLESRSEEFSGIVHRIAEKRKKG